MFVFQHKTARRGRRASRLLVVSFCRRACGVEAVCAAVRRAGSSISGSSRLLYFGERPAREILPLSAPAPSDGAGVASASKGLLRRVGARCGGRLSCWPWPKRKLEAARFSPWSSRCPVAVTGVALGCVTSGITRDTRREEARESERASATRHPRRREKEPSDCRRGGERRPR